MKIKKEYEFTHNRQLWRILPNSTGKVIIQEIDTEIKQVYFNCLQINNGKKIFENLQLDEKFWIGIEEVYGDLIFFHGYLKPDMPEHKGIIAFDINSRSVIWENKEYNFLFASDENLYCYKSFFEGKKYFALDLLTGMLKNELGDNYSAVNRIRETASRKKEDNDYVFPDLFDAGKLPDDFLLSEINKENISAGRIESARLGELLFIHALQNTGQGVRDLFKVVEIPAGNKILEKSINNKTGKFSPEAFFIKGNLLFLLKEKDTLVVYSIKQ